MNKIYEPLSVRPGDLDDINTIGFLAQQVWPETYGSILSSGQLAYMLQLFYSPAALRRQMVDDKQQFILIEQEQEALGFAAYSVTEEPGVFKLHKLYVLPGQQGKGLGRLLLQSVFDAIRPEGGKTLRLNVNRYNKARRFYERIGFAVVREEDIEIGEGYFMNDFVMEIPVPE